MEIFYATVIITLRALSAIQEQENYTSRCMVINSDYWKFKDKLLKIYLVLGGEDDTFAMTNTMYSCSLSTLLC